MDLWDKGDTIWLKWNHMKPKPSENQQLISWFVVLGTDHDPVLSSMVRSLTRVAHCYSACGWYCSCLVPLILSWLCLCFPPLANWSSFPQRDRGRYKPCSKNWLQQCPCCSWSDEMKAHANILGNSEKGSADFFWLFFVLLRYLVLIFLAHCFIWTRGMLDGAQYQNKYSSIKDDDNF